MPNPKKQAYDIFQEAVDSGFADRNLYNIMIYFLQEKWYGEPGEWQRFVENCSDKATGPAGDILTARLTWYLTDYPNSWPPFQTTHLSWGRAHAGFKALVAQYPDSLPAASAYAEMALAAGNVSIAHDLFETQLKNRVDRAIWSLNDFMRYEAWAKHYSVLKGNITPSE